MIIETALAKGLHIATAESITGGAVSARLAQTPGASKVLRLHADCVPEYKVEPAIEVLKYLFKCS